MNKALRIVHCANFNEAKNGAMFYSQDRKISHGLIKNGHFVYDFSYRTVAKSLSFLKTKKLGAKKMNKALIETVENIQPHILLLGKTEIVFESTLKNLKEKFPEMKIAMWWVDPFPALENSNEKMPYVDAFFATTDPEYFKSLYSNKTNFYYMPNICDDSFESYIGYQNKNYDCDLVFVGRKVSGRKEFLDCVLNIDDINFKIFGDTKETFLFGNDYLKQISKSKMALNYSRSNDVPLYTSDRIIQLMALGTLVLTPKFPGIDKLFNDDELVFFESFEEFEKKVKYYNKNEEKRLEKTRKGWGKAHKSYNSERVTKFMLETVFKKEYSEKYEWLD